MPKPVSQVSNKLAKAAKSREPLWRGPEDDGPLGGVTQSLLSNWLCCRERFRIKYIEGLQPEQGFSKALEFGNMHHLCEEYFAAGNPWDKPLKDYAKDLCKRYKLQQEEIEKWYNVVKRMFPIYTNYWSKHPDIVKRTPLLQEEVFHVPYKLPSGRVVWLKGKFDSVDLVLKGKNAGVWLMEHKTKGDIDEQDILQRLSFDIQTMLYLIALQTWQETSDPPVDWCNEKIVGVRYNVIRRPFSGGKGSIRQHQPTKSNPAGESKEEFFDRFINDYVLTEPDYWFARWNSMVSQADVDRYKREFLNPCLESLCDWYGWIANSKDPFGNPGNSHHFRLPFGTYNSIMETGGSDLDSYLRDGTQVGLVRVNSLFGELK